MKAVKEFYMDTIYFLSFIKLFQLKRESIGHEKLSTAKSAEPLCAINLLGSKENFLYEKLLASFTWKILERASAILIYRVRQMGSK